MEQAGNSPDGSDPDEANLASMGGAMCRNFWTGGLRSIVESTSGSDSRKHFSDQFNNRQTTETLIRKPSPKLLCAYADQSHLRGDSGPRRCYMRIMQIGLIVFLSNGYSTISSRTKYLLLLECRNPTELRPPYQPERSCARRTRSMS